jgi:hypothetical protein
MSLSEDLRANGTKTGRNYSAFGELCLLDEYIGLAATKVSAPCPSHSDGHQPAYQDIAAKADECIWRAYGGRNPTRL